MGICPVCKTRNDTCKCRNCGFDESRNYREYRFLCQLSENAGKKLKSELSTNNVLMADSDPKFVFGRKINRNQIKKVSIKNKKENIGENAWDASEKQDGSVLVWTEECEEGLFALYIAADGEIKANKDCSRMFSGYGNLKNIFGLEFLQTGQTQNMERMFAFCSELESLDVSGFNTGCVTNMSSMFLNCEKLTGLDVSGFDTSQVTDMSGMFCWCNTLTSLDVSGFDTSQAADMQYMFAFCRNLSGIDVSHFDTRQVTNMRWMFSNCENLTSVDVSGFDTSKVTDRESMFLGCDKLEQLTEGQSGTFDKPSTDNVLMADCDPKFIFGKKMDRHQVKKIYLKNKKENIGENAWDASEKQDGSVLAWTEECGEGLLALYLAADGEIKANKDCSRLFLGYGHLKNIFGLEFLRTGQTENMERMFAFCNELESLDVSGFDTGCVTNMSSMFLNCEKLTGLDVSGFDTSQVTDMSGMFCWCNTLTSLDVSGFDTSRAADMQYMFAFCRNLSGIEVSRFDTRQVTNMRWMFSDCENLESIDVSGFDTRKVTDMENMFFGCDRLKQLDVSKFDRGNIKNRPASFSKYIGREEAGNAEE